MGLGSSCRSLGAAEEEEEEGCGCGGGIASASRGLLPGETSRTGGPALGSNLKVLALQGEDVDGHGGPRLNRVLRHLKGNVLVAVIAHVNPERVLLVLASEEEEEGDRSTSASSPSGGLRRPFLPGSPPQSPVPITDAVAVAVGKPALTSVAISLALLCLSPSGAGDAMALPHSPCFLRRAVPPRWPRVCPLRAQKRTACLPERIYYASRNALRRRVEIRFPCGASQRCVLYTPHSVQESTPGFARSRTGQLCEPRAVENLPNF